MMLFLHSTLAIARATFTQSVRNKLLLLVAFFALILLGISVAAGSVSFGQGNRIILDVGLAASSLIAMITAVALGMGISTADLERREAYPLLVRPIPRWIYVVGKFLGVWLSAYLVALFLLMATALLSWAMADGPNLAFWYSFLTILFEVALAVAITLVFALYTKPALATAYTSSVLLCGQLSGDILQFSQRIQDDLPVLASASRAAYYLIPDLQGLSLRTQAANALVVPTNYLFFMSAYSLVYLTATLLIASMMFHRRRDI